MKSIDHGKVEKYDHTKRPGVSTARVATPGGTAGRATGGRGRPGWRAGSSPPPRPPAPPSRCSSPGGRGRGAGGAGAPCSRRRRSPSPASWCSTARASAAAAAGRGWSWPPPGWRTGRCTAGPAAGVYSTGVQLYCRTCCRSLVTSQTHNTNTAKDSIKAEGDMAGCPACGGKVMEGS